jgi:hypothetical protein
MLGHEYWCMLHRIGNTAAKPIGLGAVLRQAVAQERLKNKKVRIKAMW